MTPRSKSRDYNASTAESNDKDRRTEIREKAWHIFAKYGYRKTTIEDIGKACGLGKAALYHYYSGKEEVFAEVVRAESDNLLAKMRCAVDAADDPREKIVAMIKTRFNFIGKVAVEAGIADFNDMLPIAAGARQTFFQKEAKMFEQILKEGQRRGAFKQMDLKPIPRLLISALRGIETHLAEVNDPPSLETGIDILLGLFFEGICR